MADPGYEFFEHTADVGIRARGRTAEELFIHAAQALVALLVEDGLLETRQTHPITLSASSIEELLRSWLKELLFWFEADRFLPAGFHITIVESRVLRGWIDGERFDPSRHTPGTEIKGVTTHRLKLIHRDDGWVAEVIVDV